MLFKSKILKHFFFFGYYVYIKSSDEPDITLTVDNKSDFGVLINRTVIFETPKLYRSTTNKIKSNMPLLLRHG